MKNTKPITKRKRSSPPVATENKAFVKDKVKRIYKTFTDLFNDYKVSSPQLLQTPDQLLRLQHVFYGQVAPNTDEMIALRELVKAKLQSEINELETK